MNCREVKRKLVAALTGELSPTEAKHLQQHLQVCAACAREADEVREILPMLENAWAPETGEEPRLDAAHRAAIQGALDGLEVRRRSRRGWLVMARVALWSLLGAAVLISLGLPTLSKARGRVLSRSDVQPEAKATAVQTAGFAAADVGEPMADAAPFGALTADRAEISGAFARKKGQAPGGAPMAAAAAMPPMMPPTMVPVEEENIMAPAPAAVSESEPVLELALKSDSKPEPEPESAVEEFGAGLPMVRTAAQPLSTFSIDTDTASYVRAREALQQRMRPEPATIHPEDFINYFDYDYAPPTGDELFACEMAAARNPFRPAKAFLRIGIQGKQLGPSDGVDSNFVLLVDASGSMALEDRWTPAVQSVELLRDRMKPTDRFQVLYASDQMRHPGGKMDFEEALASAAQLAVQMAFPDGQNRLLLITDGDYRPDAAARERLLTMAAACREERVLLTVMGFGTPGDSRFLEELAERGGGSFVFVDGAAEVERLFLEQFEARFRPLAEDVKIQVEFNPAAVIAYRQVGYAERALAASDFRNDAVHASPVGSGQAVTAVYEVLPAPGVRPESALATVRLRYREPGRLGAAEREYLVTAADAARDFTEAPVSFQQAVLAGEFAESLKYPEASQLAQAAGLLELLPRSAVRKNQELGELLRLAR